MPYRNRTRGCCGKQCYQTIKIRPAMSAGFEPARAKPNGLAVHLLNHSDMTSKYMKIKN